MSAYFNGMGLPSKSIFRPKHQQVPRSSLSMNPSNKFLAINRISSLGSEIILRAATVEEAHYNVISTMETMTTLYKLSVTLRSCPAFRRIFSCAVLGTVRPLAPPPA